MQSEILDYTSHVLTTSDEGKVKMKYPKHEAFTVKFNNLEQAVKWATGKRKFGGCFEQKDDVFICYWLPKGHVAISNFAW